MDQLPRFPSFHGWPHITHRTGFTVPIIYFKEKHLSHPSHFVQKIVSWIVGIRKGTAGPVQLGLTCACSPRLKLETTGNGILHLRHFSSTLKRLSQKTCFRQTGLSHNIPLLVKERNGETQTRGCRSNPAPDLFTKRTAMLKSSCCRETSPKVASDCSSDPGK